MTEVEVQKSLNALIIGIKDERYILEIKDIKEIYVPGQNIVPVPLSDDTMVGIIDIRGEIYSIMALRKKIYPDENDYNLSKKSRILLLEYKNFNLALLVDQVIGVREFPIEIFQEKSTIIETNIDYDFIKAIGVSNDESYILLDIDALVPEKVKKIKKQEIRMPKKRKARQETSGPRKKKSPFKMQDSQDVYITSGQKKTMDKKISLSNEQKDILKEIGNIGSGNAVTALSRLIKKKIDVNLTDVGIINFENLEAQFGGANQMVCGIFCSIKTPSESTILQVFDLKPLLKILKEVGGKDVKIDNVDAIKSREQLDEYSVSTIKEMGNIMAGHYASALADLTGSKMLIDVPEFTMTKAGSLGSFLSEELSSISDFIILIKTVIQIKDFSLSGVFFFIPDMDSLKGIFQKLGIEDKFILSQLTDDSMDKISDLSSFKLTERQRDALQEVGNMGAGNSANALAKMINKRVDIDIPKVEMVDLDQFTNLISKDNKALFVSWSNVEGVTRATLLSIFQITDIIKITSIITDSNKKISPSKIQSINDFDDMFKSAMSELGHILASHYASAIGDLLDIRMMTEPPDMSIDTGKNLISVLKEELGLLKKLSLVITTNVIISDIKITGTFLYIPDVGTLSELLNALDEFYE